jgi:hypothetical protein
MFHIYVTNRLQKRLYAQLINVEPKTKPILRYFFQKHKEKNIKMFHMKHLYVFIRLFHL